MPDNVRRAFQMFDTDRSGDIDARELRKALQHLGMEADSAQTQGVLRKYDTAGKGKLVLVEFNKLVQELLDFQKKAGIGPKDGSKDKAATLSFPLRLVAFAAATDRGASRRELAHATLELTTTEANVSRLELPLMTDAGKKLGVVFVSLNAHTAMAPFLAIRRASAAPSRPLTPTATACSPSTSSTRPCAASGSTSPPI